MKKLLNGFLILSCLAFITACGGKDEAATEAAAEKAVEAEAPAKNANNPLASQQQLIKDAQAVQDLLDKDAEKKKKALEEIN